MSFFYTTERVGRDGKVFKLYKIRTLKEGTTSQYSHGDSYTKHGKFLRKYRIDEIPQLWNILKGDMSLVGPRPDSEKGWSVVDPEIKAKMLSVKPGLFGIAGLFFFEEEKILAMASLGATEVYWKRVRPMKFILDAFYVENKCFILDFTLIYLGVKTVLKEFLHHGKNI